MQVSVAYANALSPLWVRLEVAEETTVEQAIILSGIIGKCPEIDLESNRVGIFGKPVKLQQVLKEGDRVEIYRPITADPETIERRDM